MSLSTLPYFQYLRATIASLASSSKDDPAAAMQAAVALRLLDHAIVERTTAAALRTEAYAATAALLAQVEAILGVPQLQSTPATATPDVDKLPAADAGRSALHALKAICACGATDDFERYLQLAGDVQRGLSRHATPAALALCKALARIEGDYVIKFAAALNAESAVRTTEKPGGATARNVREIDHAALLDFLRKSFPEEKDLAIAESSFISGGYSKFTARIALANARTLPSEIILRGDAGATFGGSSVVDEYHTIKLMYDNGVAVPRPLALEESGKIFGSPFLLVERKPGSIVGHMYNLPQMKNQAACRDVGAQLAMIHRVPLAQVGSLIEGASTPSSAKALAWIEEGYNNWLPLNMPSPVFEAAWEWLRAHAHVYDKGPRGVVHGDYGLNNILIHEDKVSTILDWEFCHVGNTAYDLGYFYFMAEALYSWDEFLAGYTGAGMMLPDEEQLNYSLVLAATRLGVMVYQTKDVFVSGAEPGIAGAAVIGGAYCEETVRRIALLLDRVL